MKVKVLSRSARYHTNELKSDARRLDRNLDPNLHPGTRAVEYKRAVNAAKLGRMFAKPFLCAFDQFMDTPTSISLHPSDLSFFVAGDFNGDIRIYHLPSRSNVLTIPKAHQQQIAGVEYLPDGDAFLSCSMEKTVRLWNASPNQPEPAKAISEWHDEEGFTCITQNANKLRFATAGTELKLWDINRTQPLHKFAWGYSEIISCAFNKSQTNLLACASRDRAICIYDTNTERAAQKVVLEQKTRQLCWNPMEPTDFIAANDNGEIFLFDCRRLRFPKARFTGHVDIVTSVSFAPTGREFVSGSLDKTVRLWELAGEGAHDSRDMYHAMRMAEVQTVAWTLDNAFVLSGSKDCNVRLWKANASKPLRPMHPSEQRNLEYHVQLRERFKDLPEVRRISRQKFTPVSVKKKKGIKEKIVRHRVRRQQNIRLHTTAIDTELTPKDDKKMAKDRVILGLVQ
eukprot:TRINITY_DN81498_c0_g1_i1.p1 TRINITY_DN81498_c0_g1~~TRINITY_DN81498_c0_g1_i1.p1  ORF type:complete len:464 (+),score=103.46 TRINITY_DN81498_c0_g1_i1:28-1392(+)